MRRGKEVAQGSHASMAFIVEQLRGAAGATTISLSEVEREWIDAGTAKVCLRVNSEAELVEHHRRALDAGLKSRLVRDSGRTEFGGVATLTACAIGPDEAARIDEITGDLMPY